MSDFDMFMIKLEDEEWSPIKAVEVQEQDRKVLRMQSGWGDTILSAVRRDYAPIPCPFKYEKQQFFKKKGFPFFIFKGYCKECCNQIHGVCQEKPIEGQGVSIWVKTKNTVGIPHQNRRRLANNRRKIIKQKLLHVQPTLFKHLNAAKSMNDSGTASPFHHSTPVYQVARQEARDEELNLKDYPGPPLDSLLLIMEKNSVSVRRVSTDPVVVWYWSELQIKLSNQVSSEHLSISIDAAGRFVRPVEILKGHSSGPIFLYNLCVKIDNKICFLSQMLSSKHDTETILLWLRAWIKSGASPPYEIVADCSKALLNALCLAFNNSFYSDYLDDCLSLITKESVIKPKTLVKRDRNHLIKAVTRWKVFHPLKTNPVAKDFYLRVIAFALEIRDIKMIRKVILGLFIVCESEGIDSSSVCDEYFSYLEKKIAHFSYEEEDPENCAQNLTSSAIDDPDEIKSCKMAKYIKEIKLESIQLLQAEGNNFTEVNSYCVPGLIDNLESLFTEFPAWTSIMHPFFEYKTSNVSTSSGSELGYRIMRTNYNMNKVVTINRFLINHLRILDGATKEGLSQMKEYLRKKNATDKQIIVHDDDEELMMADDNLMIVDDNSMMDDNDLTSVDIVKSNSVHIINGSLIQIPIDFQGRRVHFTNTCAFDSIFELFVHSATSYPNTVAKYFEKHQHKNSLFKLAHEYLNKNVTDLEFQKGRATLIHPLLSPKERNSLVSINCEVNVNSLLTLLLGSTGGSVNLIACEECHSSINEAGRPLIVQETKIPHLSDRDSSIKDTISLCVQSVFEGTELKCRSCQGSAEKTLYSIDSFIIIDIESIFQRKAFFCDTSDIPLILTYSNFTLKLTGVIAYEPNHYVSYLYSALNDTWELKDDTVQKKDIRKSFSQIKIHVLVYCKN